MVSAKPGLDYSSSAWYRTKARHGALCLFCWLSPGAYIAAIKIKDQRYDRWMMEKPKLEVPRVTSNVSLLLRTTMQDLVYFVSRGVHRVYSGRFAGHCPHPRSLSLSFQDSLVSNKSPCCVAFVCCKRMMSAELRKRKGRQQPQGNVLLVV